ncbi:hypothetical protein GEMRC1_002658 [Eukaryota sp. GEM-RC1]
MQFSLHALTGLLLVRFLRYFKKWDKNVLSSTALTVFYGSLAADLDVYIQGIVFFFNAEASHAYHRSFTHSIVILLVAFIASLLIWKRRKIPVCGFFAAYALHLLSDIFFWFASIDLFWPLTIVPPIDIWKNIDYPAELRYFTRSFEFIFASVFFFILFKLRSKSFKESLTVPIIAALHLLYGLALILMHFTLSSSVVFIFVFAPLLLLTAPLTYYYSWKWKQVLYNLACPPKAFYAVDDNKT